MGGIVLAVTHGRVTFVPSCTVSERGGGSMIDTDMASIGIEKRQKE